MNIIKRKYETWLKAEKIEENLKEELLFMTDKHEKIEDAFYRELEFGTSGMRGVMGAGTNRINLPVVRRLTQGVSNFLKERNSEPRVVICYDTRNFSEEFAKGAAEIFAGNRVTTYIAEEPMPLSVLSFAVKEMNADLGVMITASHNSKEYNGYKVYDSTGKQILKEQAEAITKHLKKVDYFDDIREKTLQMDLDYYIKELPEYILNSYEEAIGANLEEFKLAEGGNEDIKIVYTPLNGTGAKVMPAMFENAGFLSVLSVEEQATWSGEFETCPSPNPEKEEAFALAIELAQKESADLIIANDPDSDRLGMAVPFEEGYKVLNGNDIAALLLNYILVAKATKNAMPQKPIIIRTIATTPLLDKMVEGVGGEVIPTFVGFKHIGEKINELEKEGRSEDFVFGAEEAFGYLASDFVRDKDGISTALIAATMAKHYKNEGKSLIEVLDEIKSTHGYFVEKSLNYNMAGSLGEKARDRVMERVRKHFLKADFGMDAKIFIDYEDKQQRIINGQGDYHYPITKKLISLEPANAVEFLLEKGKVIIRPSGTEPKMKVYVFAIGENKIEAEENMAMLYDKVNEYMEKHLNRVNFKLNLRKAKQEEIERKEEAARKEDEEFRERRRLQNEAEKAERLAREGITEAQSKQADMSRYRKQPPRKLREKK